MVRVIAVRAVFVAKRRKLLYDSYYYGAENKDMISMMLILIMIQTMLVMTMMLTLMVVMTVKTMRVVPWWIRVPGVVLVTTQPQQITPSPSLDAPGSRSLRGMRDASKSTQRCAILKKNKKKNEKDYFRMIEGVGYWIFRTIMLRCVCFTVCDPHGFRFQPGMALHSYVVWSWILFSGVPWLSLRRELEMEMARGKLVWIHARSWYPATSTFGNCLLLQMQLCLGRELLENQGATTIA